MSDSDSSAEAPVIVRNVNFGVGLEQRARHTVFPRGRFPDSSSEWKSLPDEQPQSNGSIPGAGGRSPPPPAGAQLIDSSADAVGVEKASTVQAGTQGPWTVDASDEFTSCEPNDADPAAAAAAAADAGRGGVAPSSTSTVLSAESSQVYRPVIEEPDDYWRCLSNQLFGPVRRCSDRCSVASLSSDSDSMDCENTEDISATFEQQQQQPQMSLRHHSSGDHMCPVDVVACQVIPSSTTESTQTDPRTHETSSEGVRMTSRGEGAVPLTDELLQSSSPSPKDASPNLRSRSCRKSNSERKRLVGGGGGGGGGVDKSASPVSHRLNPSESGADDGHDAVANGDDGSGDDDEDDGVYSETFRYSSYKYVGEDNDDDNDVTGIDSPADGVLSEEKLPERRHDGRVGCSRSESKLCDRFENKNHQRSFSVTTAESKGSGESIGKTLSRKIIKRHISLGAETYQMPSDRVYEVERTLILKKPDSVTSFGFHLLGQNPMVISTIEPGSIAEFNGVQIGDRLITVNGTDVIKASRSTLIDIISQSPTCLKLGVASGVLSRDICICSGYLNLKPDGIMRNWKRRWCQLKYDGFLYYYKADDCSSPLGAISMSNYVIIRGSDCGRGSVFKLVKYGQKTYYIQAGSDEEMNWWASNINTATLKTNSFCDTWLDISSHNVLLPALSIKRPECHGYLTKVGNRNTNWRRRYCVLKSACLYYYKDQTSSTAKGVAHLHGYSIEEETMYHRKFGFMAVPPVAQMRTFHFTAENETDKQRWMAALKLSIGKWVKVDDD